MKRARLWLCGCLVVCLALVVGARDASANSPGPCFGFPLLGASIDGDTNTVFVWTDEFDCDEQNVPEDLVLVRENLDTGEIVEIPILCGAQYEESDPEFVDECVPAGTYRYGLTNITPCGGFPEVVVSELDECSRTNPDEVPVAYEGDYDWSYTDGNTSGCSMTSSPAGIVFPVYLLSAALAIGLILRRRKLEK